MYVKKFLTIITCIIMFSACATTYAGEKATTTLPNKVGYINLQRLVNESEMGKNAQKDLEKLRNQKSVDIKKKEKTVEELRDNITVKGPDWPESERKDKIDELQKIYKDYQRMVSDAKEEIEKQDKELVAKILEKADNILKTIAKQEKYTMIIKDPNAVGYLEPSVDITDMVLKELNKLK